MDNDNEYIKVRREKIQKLREEGVDPFKNDLKPSILIQDLKDIYADQIEVLACRLRKTMNRHRNNPDSRTKPLRSKSHEKVISCSND